jgi:hypothetical protein
MSLTRGLWFRARRADHDPPLWVAKMPGYAFGSNPPYGLPEAHTQKPPRFPSTACVVALRLHRGLPRRAVLERSPSLRATGRIAIIKMRQSMRCLYVGVNVSPMWRMLSPAMMLIKPALLS